MRGVFDWLGDAWGATGGKVVDVAGDVFEGIPVTKPLVDLVNGPLRDFANTPLGKVVLRAIATQLTGGLAWTLGPQLATIAWTLPGLFRGEAFDDAWLAEFKWRTEKTAEILGPGLIEIFKGQIKDALDALGAEFGVGNYVTIGAQALADKLHIREDVAAFAIDLWNRIGPPGRDAYALVTGDLVVPPGASRFDVERINTEVEGRAAIALALDAARGGYVPGYSPTAVEGRAARYATSSPAPATVSPSRPVAVAAGAPDNENKKAGDVLLLATILAAGGAVVWFFVWERGKA